MRSRVGGSCGRPSALMDAARNYLFPIYASLLTPGWCACWAPRSARHRDLHRAAHPEVHRRRGRRVPGRRHHGRLVRARRRLDPRRPRRRSASAHSWATPDHPARPAGSRRRPGGGARRRRTRPSRGSSWLGSPPIRLRRKPTAADALRTFHPSPTLKAMRGTVEPARLIPVMVTFGIGVAVLGAARRRRLGLKRRRVGRRRGAADRRRCAGAIAVVAKWVVMGRIRAVEHPLWSSFVWRNEVWTPSSRRSPRPGSPGRHRHARDEPPVARAGRQDRPRVWCETHWLPEADLT